MRLGALAWLWRRLRTLGSVADAGFGMRTGLRPIEGALMRTRLLLAVAAVAATLTLAACSGSPTAPREIRPGGRTDYLTCRSGYFIATRADGSEYCAPEPQAAMRAP
jgi:hypothetical protein